MHASISHRAETRDSTGSESKSVEFAARAASMAHAPRRRRPACTRRRRRAWALVGSRGFLISVAADTAHFATWTPAGERWLGSRTFGRSLRQCAQRAAMRMEIRISNRRARQQSLIWDSLIWLIWNQWRLSSTDIFEGVKGSGPKRLELPDHSTGRVWVRSD